MHRMEQLKRVLEILLSYPSDSYDVCAEHDCIYLHGPIQRTVSVTHTEELESFGCEGGLGDNEWMVYV